MKFRLTYILAEPIYSWTTNEIVKWKERQHHVTLRAESADSAAFVLQTRVKRQYGPDAHATMIKTERCIA